MVQRAHMLHADAHDPHASTGPQAHLVWAAIILYVHVHIWFRLDQIDVLVQAVQ